MQLLFVSLVATLPLQGIRCAFVSSFIIAERRGTSTRSSILYNTKMEDTMRYIYQNLVKYSLIGQYKMQYQSNAYNLSNMMTKIKVNHFYRTSLMQFHRHQS